MIFNLFTKKQSRVWNPYKYAFFASVLLLIIVWVYFMQWWKASFFLMLAVVFGLYMAVNIWANDVANNMWPAVWSKALTLWAAIIIAAIFEAGWAIIAGWDVVDTIKSGIIDWNSIWDTKQFLSIMLATLLWASIWIHLATFLRAPVSATHSIIGWLVWAWFIATYSWLYWDKLFFILLLLTWITSLSLLVWLLIKDWVELKYKDPIVSIFTVITLFVISFSFLYNVIFKEIYSLTHIIIWENVIEWWQLLAIWASWIISPLMWWIIAVILLVSIRSTILKKEERDEAAKKWVPFYVALMGWVFTTYLLLKWLKQVLDKNIITTEFALIMWFIAWIVVYILVWMYLRKESTFFKNSKKSINWLFNIPLIFAVALLSFAHWANDVANAIGPIAAINDVVQNGLWHWKASISTWIMILWATWLALGLMVFWSRLIKTVWKWITKLNQTKAYSVALSAAITVLIASQLWLPVSSTHIALGWVFWVGLLKQHIKMMNWKDKEYIKKEMIYSIATAWVVTLPITWIISWLVYFWLMKTL